MEKNSVAKTGKKESVKKAGSSTGKGTKRPRTKELLIVGPEIKVNGKTVAGGIQTIMLVPQLPDLAALVGFCRDLHSRLLMAVFPCESPVAKVLALGKDVIPERPKLGR